MGPQTQAHTLFFLSLCVLSLLVAMPTFAAVQQTADLSAGFAPNSIWASRTRITAGESVTLYTVLYNSSDAPLVGDAVFMVDGKPVGAKRFSVKAGETTTASVPWSAVLGKHSLSARIEKPAHADTKQDAAILNKTTDTITIEVAEPPPPPPPLPPSPAAQAASAVGSALVNGFSTAAPVVGSAAQKAYAATEALRKKTAAAIEKQLAKNQQQTAASSQQKQTTGNGNAGTVADAATVPARPDASPLSILSKIWRTFLQGALFILNITALFYITLVLAVFVVIRFFLFALRDRRRY